MLLTAFSSIPITCIQKLCVTGSLKVGIVWERVNVFAESISNITIKIKVYL